MNRSIDQLSQLILEADALLLLLHKHREETPSDAIIMLKRKLHVILSLIDDFEEEQPEEKSATEPTSQHTECKTEIAKEETTTFFTQPEITEVSEDNISWHEVTDEFEDLVEGAVEENIDTIPVIPETDAYIPAEQKEVSAPTQHEMNSPVANEPVRNIPPVSVSEPVISDHEPTINASAPSATTQSVKSNSRRPVSSIFNLNDKFRFRRELFGNSEIAYVECLNMLSAMYSLDEATDYLYEDLNWDPNNEDVKSFVELLKNYYNS